MHPAQPNEALSPEATETLNDILEQHKKGNTSTEAARFQITELFKRQPVNYRRHYSDAPEKPLLEKGSTIGLNGFGAASGQYQVEAAREDPASKNITLSLKPVQGHDEPA